MEPSFYCSHWIKSGSIIFLFSFFIFLSLRIQLICTHFFSSNNSDFGGFFTSISQSIPMKSLIFLRNSDVTKLISKKFWKFHIFNEQAQSEPSSFVMFWNVTAKNSSISIFSPQCSNHKAMTNLRLPWLMPIRTNSFVCCMIESLTPTFTLRTHLFRVFKCCTHFHQNSLACGSHFFYR